MDLRKIQDLKDVIERSQREADREEGAQIELRKTLKEKFSCEDLASSEELLQQIDENIAQLNRDIEVRRKSFESRMSGRLS